MAESLPATILYELLNGWIPIPKSSYESDARPVMLTGGYRYRSMHACSSCGVWPLQAGDPGFRTNGICSERLYGTIGSAKRRITTSAPKIARTLEVLRRSLISTSARYCASTDCGGSVRAMHRGGPDCYLRVYLRSLGDFLQAWHGSSRLRRITSPACCLRQHQPSPDDGRILPPVGK